MPICSAWACGVWERLVVERLRMRCDRWNSGKPGAGNPPARFEEGGGGSVPVPPLLDQIRGTPRNHLRAIDRTGARTPSDNSIADPGRHEPPSFLDRATLILEWLMLGSGVVIYAPEGLR